MNVKVAGGKKRPRDKTGLLFVMLNQLVKDASGAQPQI
jgi:hypothetical protein